jgi:gliding motility-associated-like protein
MMGRIYTIYGKLFFALACLSLLASYEVKAQDFVVKGQCMLNPDCEADSTMFSDTVKTAVAWRWDFGDVVENTSTRKKPGHSYATPGEYTVTLVRTLSDGTQQTVIQRVQIGELPPSFQNWKPDTTICPDQSITLDPYPNGGPTGAKYIWFPKGDTTQTLQVDSSGCYSVEVILPNGCKIQDKVNVKVCMEPVNQEGGKWYFGANAGLDFTGGSPQPLTDGKVNTPEGVSTMSNSKGELLFYSDGVTVFNRDGEEMECSSNDCGPLKGSPNSTQSVLIVPQPTCRGCEYLFNVFTTTEINGQKTLTVSTVDMRRENGKGAIIELNTVLQDSTTERLASSRNDADSTYWVISHDYGSNQFRVFHATTGGLVESGVYGVGMSHDTPAMAQGYMKLSSVDTTTGERRLAVVIGGPPTNYVELFHFNDETGAITYDRTIDLGPAPPTAYGVEFSPDGSKMYVSYQGDGTAKSYLDQFTLASGDSLLIAESKIRIDSSDTQKFGALQIATDGRIYMAVEGSDYLAVIANPDQESITLMEYEREGINLGGKKSTLGLPNMVQNYTEPQDGPGFSADGFCTGEPTMFQASPLCDPIEDTYFWDFGDGGFASGKETQQEHIYTQPGIYTVKLTASNQCMDTTFVQQIEIFETPAPFSLGDDQDVCRNFVKLEISSRASNYLWEYRGRVVSTDSVYHATQTGRYIAYAFNGPPGLACFQSDTIELTIRRPPAFSLGPDVAMCENDSAVLSAPGLTWREFEWSTGESTRDITVRQAGTYFVEVKNANDCYNSDTLEVTLRPSPILDMPSEYVLCIGDANVSVTLDARGRGELTYYWPATGDSTQTTVVTDIGRYTVTATDTAGCTTDGTTEVIDKCEPRLFVPEAFSPNGDGTNDKLEVFGKYFNNYSIRVFSRWGEVIFASNNVDEPWDGSYRGEMVQPGVYAYIVSYGSVYFPERPPVTIRGSVMVIR